MPLNDTMRAAFQDEINKIAGEMHGATRIGRRPISIDRLLESEAESEVRPSDVAVAGYEKTSGSPEAFLTPGRKAVALLATGAGGYHFATKANSDRKLGKAVRLQSRQNQ